MKVYQLIKQAFYCSGINSPDLNDMEHAQLMNGFFQLQLLLAEKKFKTYELPYYETVEIDAVSGQQDYFLENMYTLDCMTFNIGNIRFSMSPTTRRQFKGEARAENISSLPSEFYYERVNGGLKVSLYFLPNSNYPLKFTGLKGFGNYIIDDELNDYVDLGYQSFILYELARKLCVFYVKGLPPSLKEEIDKLKDAMLYVNPPDTSFTYDSPFKSNSTNAFMYVNRPFYSGYIPS